MSTTLMQYGLFLAQTITVVLGIGALIVLLASMARRERGPERLEVKSLNRRYREFRSVLRREVLSRKHFKAQEKVHKRALKTREKSPDESRKRIFVLDFRGDIKASAVASLREEITAVITVARPSDEVLLRLENAGGLVHEHGLAASQLLRLRSRSIRLTVAIDKIAASGGYMMACVADHVLAAPFAVLGSIGVLLQLPNFNRLLQSTGVDFEQIKGGEFKRTLTVFGENTDAERTKAKHDVEDIHALFKDFVVQHRPQLDIDRVATGEHWYGARAVDLALCDELQTSDDYLLGASETADLYEIAFVTKKPLGRKLAAALHALVEPLAWRHGLGLRG